MAISANQPTKQSLKLVLATLGIISPNLSSGTHQRQHDPSIMPKISVSIQANIRTSRFFIFVAISKSTVNKEFSASLLNDRADSVTFILTSFLSL
jgi:hypothetical protein